MLYEEYRAPAALRDIVAAFWRFELDAGDPPEVEHTIPPDGTMTIAVAGTAGGPHRMAIVGPRVTALRVPVRRDHRYAGARLHPGVGPGVLGVSAASLRERVVAFDTIAPQRAAELRRALSPWPSGTAVTGALGPLLIDWADSGPAPDAVVRTMVARIQEARGGGSVRALCDGTGVGYRHALRRFQASVGLSPKELSRLVRIREACMQALAPERGSWAEIAAAAGFADHAHLAREFGGVYGWPPSLVSAYLRRIEHRNVRL